MTASLRTATLDDALAYDMLRRAVFPYQVGSAASVRHRWETTPEAARQLVLVAQGDGEVVGVGRAGLNTWTSEEGAADLFVMVHPDHRGTGVGTSVYDSLVWHLRDIGARRVQGWAADDEATGAWCASRGFERRHEIRFSRLDLSDPDALPPAPDLPDGVTVASFAEVGPEAVHRVDAEATADEPGDVTYDAIGYDEWLTDIWQAPLTDHEASTVVLVGGEAAAYTLVEADRDDGRMWSGGTGTLREHRGRGLAKIAKSVALRRAAKVGITDAYTSNDEENGPMLAINEWLGYRPCARQWSQVKVM
jgi:RimJ/RimL family protein N-acetyltransferase